MTAHHRIAALLAVGIIAARITVPAFAAQRTFVSTSGLDTSISCALQAPCRGFTKALTLTDPGGEIIVLDSGGYGSVTINKNVSIISPSGVYAGVTVFVATDGITVAPPAAKVALRGLSINGQGGNNGIRVQSGEVNIESTVISNVGAAGVLVEAGTTVRLSGVTARGNTDGLRVLPGVATGVIVVVRDSEFSGNTSAGVGVSPTAAGSNAQVTVERSSLVRNSTGASLDTGGTGSGTLVVTQSVASENTSSGVLSNGSGATVWVRETAVTRNANGLMQAASAVLNACGANLLAANGTATVGAINTASCLDVASSSGTVTNVATGSGLTGGPITTSGTINLAGTQLLPTVACGTNQVPQWNGSVWTCATIAGGPAPASTVVSGTSFGQGAAVGASLNYAREDHTHGTPTLPALGGDVTGSIGANTVGGLQGRNVASTAPATGNLLAWNGSSWSPTPDVLRGYQIVKANVSVPANFLAQFDVGCPAGKSALSGGLELPGASVGEQINIVTRQSYPTSASVWRQLVSNVNAVAISMNFYAICAST